MANSLKKAMYVRSVIAETVFVTKSTNRFENSYRKRKKKDAAIKRSIVTAAMEVTSRKLEL